MGKSHRFLDLRDPKRPQELWLEQSSSGYFRYEQGLYSEHVLRLVGIVHSPLAEPIHQQQPALRFGNPANVRILNGRALGRYESEQRKAAKRRKGAK